MDAIQENLNQLKQMFCQRMDTFEKVQSSQTSSPDKDNLGLEFVAFKNFTLTSLKTLQSQIEILAIQMDQQETRGRRKILLLHGLHQEQEENVSVVVTKALVELMKLTNFDASAIGRCYRMGRVNNTGKPRPILFELRDEATRDNIWALKKVLKGSSVTISEFLTRTRHEVYLAARQKFGITRCYTRSGTVLVVGLDGFRHRVNCMEDINRLLSKDSSRPVKKTQKATTAAQSSKAGDQPKPKRNVKK